MTCACPTRWSHFTVKSGECNLYSRSCFVFAEGLKLIQVKFFIQAKGCQVLATKFCQEYWSRSIFFGYSLMQSVLPVILEYCCRLSVSLQGGSIAGTVSLRALIWIVFSLSVYDWTICNPLRRKYTGRKQVATAKRVNKGSMDGAIPAVEQKWQRSLLYSWYKKRKVRHWRLFSASEWLWHEVSLTQWCITVRHWAVTHAKYCPLHH